MVLSVCLCLYQDYVFEYAPIFNDFGICALLHLRKPVYSETFSQNLMACAHLWLSLRARIVPLDSKIENTKEKVLLILKTVDS